MAHRNTKITRNIVQTCNKLCTLNKSGLSCISHKTTTDFPEFPKDVNTNNFRSSVSSVFINEVRNCWGYNSPDADIIEKLNGHKESPSLFSGSLQKNDIYNLHNVEPELISSKKSLPLVNITRSYVKKKSESCKYPNPKCAKNRQCPKFILRDCPQALDPPNCRRKYKPAQCTKKMAPYPSYSELCAYRLEDDPSECHQCPWTKCGGVDDIKPQKKGYHTASSVMNLATIPRKNFSNTPVSFLEKQCDASKEPCKEPPPKCKKRDKKKEKDKCPQKDKKKCSDQADANEGWIISGSVRNLDLQRYYFGRLRFDRMKDDADEPTGMVSQFAYQFKDKSHSKCPKRDKPKCPDVNHTEDTRYKPFDPCCTDAKKGRQAPKKPKVFVPTRRNY